MTQSIYETFIAKVREIKTLNSIGAVLNWDQETQMPPKAANMRADQLASISGLAHEKLVSDEMGELLDKLSASSELSETERANVREVRRIFDREKRVPTELVQELAKTQSLAHEAWINARKNSDFARFAPSLEKIIQLRRKAATLIGGKQVEGRPEALYDVLLDEYEPGAKVKDIEPVFTALRQELVPLVAKIKSSEKKPRSLEGRFPAQKQREFGAMIARDMGFDFEAGRLDVSAHPFCTSFSPLDVRITTRYDESDFSGSLFGIMHETGHALYEQGFEAKNTFTPLAEAVSMGIHESQSRLWENLVGRSRPFWTHYYSKLQNAFPEALSKLSLEDFYGAINVVEPSLIRVEADEVTYNLHILLRFELERAIIADEISVSVLPELWNRKMEEYLGVRPKNDAEGVLQDIHWSMGAFGYFPTYTLGNLYAAQFFSAATRDIADLSGRMGRGELLPLREWLRDKIHRHGAMYRADDLCRRVTGTSLDAKHFVEYLKGKFGGIYAVQR